MKEKNTSGLNAANVSVSVNGIKDSIGDGVQNLLGKARKVLAPMGMMAQEGDSPVDPFDFLTSQHREVDSLFAELERVGSGSVRSKKDIFMELARKLEAHSQAEEKVLYPKGRDADEKQTLEAYEEHKLVRVVIDDLVKGGDRVDSTQFQAHVKVLKDVVHHHVKEEENEYFKKMRADMDSSEILALGQRLKQEYERIEKVVMRQPVGSKKPINAATQSNESPRRGSARQVASDGVKKTSRAKKSIAAKSPPAKTKTAARSGSAKAKSTARVDATSTTKKASVRKGITASKSPARAATRGSSARKGQSGRSTHA